MEKEKFLEAVRFCATHTTCTRCPQYHNCKGAADMLVLTLRYILDNEPAEEETKDDNT